MLDASAMLDATHIDDSRAATTLAVTSIPAPAASPEAGEILDVALRIREFEMCLLELFKQGLISGTVHTCVGQELCAAALHPHLRPGLDAFFATHRGHGHYLAHGGPEPALFAEMMGREGALCLGRGGTQNLKFQRFFSAGIQGSSAPIAVGFAYGLKHRGEAGIAVAQLGDGTLGEGAVYEAFTFAAWLKAPVLFLVEHNGWAQSTDTSRTTPGDVCERARGFGLESHWIDDSDPARLSSHLEQVVARVRRGQPWLQVIDTRRLLAHSKGDDNRPAELIERLRDEDPVNRTVRANSSLQNAGRRHAGQLATIAADVATRPLIDSAQGQVLPDLTRPISSRQLHAELLPADNARMRIAELLCGSLHDILADNSNVIAIGEDLLDPYGGAFKVTKGLSTKYPQQVLSTPIAEAAIAGTANGMALAGLRPVAEIMFADFATLTVDQLVNFSAKFHYMYGQDVACPLTLRLVSGGGRGYGPTHSQSLERLFCGVPGLRVVALSQRHSPAVLLRRVVLDDNAPTVFVEHKLLYGLRPASELPLDLVIDQADEPCSDYPPLCYVPAGGQSADVTVVTYGGSTPAVEAALRELIEQEELRFDYFVLTQLWPQRLEAVAQSVRRTRKLVVVEENVADFGIASAVVADLVQQVGPLAARTVGAESLPIPAVRHLEDLVLPTTGKVAAAIRAVLA
jgi:2-oxoisovalerate dehydrogenase E1 component